MKIKVLKKNKKENMEVNGIGENGIDDGPCEYLKLLNHQTWHVFVYICQSF